MDQTYSMTNSAINSRLWYEHNKARKAAYNQIYYQTHKTQCDQATKNWRASHKAYHDAYNRLSSKISYHENRGNLALAERYRIERRILRTTLPNRQTRPVGS